MMEWISVKDRLPDKYTRLSYIYGPNCGVVSIYENTFIFWSDERQRWKATNHLDFEYDFKDEITHWLPRPDPPITLQPPVSQ